MSLQLNEWLPKSNKDMQTRRGENAKLLILREPTTCAENTLDRAQNQQGPELLCSGEHGSEQIARLMAKWQVPILTSEVLKTHIPLKLFYTEPENF
jgi:hypothetical protein